MTSIENVTGSANFMNYLHGDSRDNVLIGGENIDWFEGREGADNDMFDGGVGNDTLSGVLARIPSRADWASIRS